MNGECPQARCVDEQLERLATDVIRRHLDLEDQDNQAFLSSPDDRGQHQTRWHQWGIITHTRVFLRHYLEDVPRYLREWEIWDECDGVLSQSVDGISRWELLQVAILLHDIGKFAVRFRGRHRFHFTGHEEASGTIVREELNLADCGLTPAQIGYVARTAEDHFVLALARKRAREQGAYSETYVGSADFREMCREIRAAHSDDFIEIGVLFLGDSLAKADPESGPEDALSQHATNVLLARRYLQFVLEMGP